jgi:GH15 family glucan-1,4-alpha-glucosidase
VLDRGVDHDRGTFVQQYDHPETDAALLLIPTTGFVAPDDPLVTGTVAAVVEELADGDLLRRYDNEDHLEGREGAFLACSFWLAECLAGLGRIDEAREAFTRTAATANDLGLYSEEFDVADGRALGNFPQALTHLSHVVAAVAISEAERGGIDEPTLG